MSLSNPNKPVTEQRLSEFYQQILPYLGGMPDILANKFSRADLYSTDEKMIGRWIGGKPLYQKVIEINPYVKGAYTRVDLSGLNIDTMVSYHGFANIDRNNVITVTQDTSLAAEDTSPRFYLEFRNKNSATEPNRLIYRVNYPENTSPLSAYITIQYTKTTDSSVEIGVDTDYSTDEKIVGTWVDGKPIYQKVIYVTSALSNNQNIPHNISDADVVMIKNAYSLRNGVVTPISYAYYNNTSSDNFDCAAHADRTNITLMGGAAFFTYRATDGGIFILQYTKTTD